MVISSTGIDWVLATGQAPRCVLDENMASLSYGETDIKQINIQINTYLYVLISVRTEKHRVLEGVSQETHIQIGRLRNVY